MSVSKFSSERQCAVNKNVVHFYDAHRKAFYFDSNPETNELRGNANGNVQAMILNDIPKFKNISAICERFLHSNGTSI